MKKFKITFSENKKYNSISRTVTVYAENEDAARNVFAQQFDTLRYNEKLMKYAPTGKRVTISNFEEVVEKEEIAV